MNPPSSHEPLSELSGIVSRVTYHGPETGWSVLKVTPFQFPQELITVTVHQCKVFAGATMDFFGHWHEHPKYGRQFKAEKVVEKKPATLAALEKYLGSGLIFGVGPVTAKRIVKHFAKDTLDIFENDIDRLREVRGIAHEKLSQIQKAWEEHRGIREVMMFLQTHGISTLFSVKIYKTYGKDSIQKVQANPYQLAKDIYGIGFFSADKVALALGFPTDGEQRIKAAIKHVVSSGRDDGHCYITKEQISSGVLELVQFQRETILAEYLQSLVKEDELKLRQLKIAGEITYCYYIKSLYFDELFVAKKIRTLIQNPPQVEKQRVEDWILRYCQQSGQNLSEEQAQAVIYAASQSFSVLTGGPGCGKTTTTKAIVKLLQAMKVSITLTAPTGRAAQRMGEVIGLPAKTIHRLLVWSPQTGGFKKNVDSPLETDFLIVDECSMLDISLTAHLLKALPSHCRVLFIGDSDQLPSVGPGHVLGDLIASKIVPCFKLTKVFRQAQSSSIIEFAHQMNCGQVPKIPSPFAEPKLWSEGADCLFIDSEELTTEQVHFLFRAKKMIQQVRQGQDDKIIHREKKGGDHFQEVSANSDGELFFHDIPSETMPGEGQSTEQAKHIFNIPSKFLHVDLQQVGRSQREVEEIKSILKKVHPWSTLNYGLTATQTLRKLLLETIPKYFPASGTEVQILSPMTRGGLGTIQLNYLMQETLNPQGLGKGQIQLGGKILRVGDRVIQKRNNYDLGVFNGDIGEIAAIDAEKMQALIRFDLKLEGGGREVSYEREDLNELDLAYAITIHKSQGSEFDVVIIPVMTQHFKMLFRNLIYTGLTRAKKLCCFIGTRRALAMSVLNVDSKVRQTALSRLIKSSSN